MKKLINRALAAKKTNFFFMALLCAGSVLANEATPQTAIQETTIEETAYLGVDTIIMGEDTVFVPVLPRPIILDTRTPRKATAAATCPTDSIVGFDTNDNYASKTEYEYDEAGNVIAEIQYKWVNGVKTGISRYWKVFTGSTATTTVNYTWDAIIGDWVNKDSTQILNLPNGKKQSTANYVWENNAWRENTLTEYEYNAKNVLILETSKSWNAVKQALDYTSKHEYEYDSNNNKILDATWTYSNDAWIGSKKDEWKYDSNKNKISEESYYGWENNNWKGRANGKKEYEYNASKQITQTIVYTWSAGAWLESTKEEKQYNGSNVSNLANYSWANGAWVGTSRDSTAWINDTIEAITFNWNDKWELNTKTQSVNAGSNQIANIPLKWDAIAEKWIGNGTKWEKTYVFTNKVEKQINYIWSTDKWVAFTKDSTKWISSSLSESTSKYEWKDGAWVGLQKVRNTYNKSNKPISNETLAWGGSEDNWRDSLHTLYEYNASNVEILKVNAKKVGEEWQAIDSTKREIEYVTIAGKKLTKFDASSKWTASSGVWTGTGTKTINEFDENGNKITVNTYSVKSGEWVNKDSIRYVYKDGNASQKELEVKMTWSSNRWIGSYRYEYTFGDTVANIRYTWNKTKNDWQGASNSATVYKADGKTVLATISYSWNTDRWAWVGAIKHEYEQDLKGRQIQDITLNYDLQLDDWQNQNMWEYEYDEKHTEAIMSEYSVWTGSKWCYSTRKEKSYDQNTAGRLRYELDETYADCDLTVSDMKRYYYHCDTYWKILFVDWDGKEIANLQVLDSETPKNPGKQTREADKQYTYEFTGWGEKIVAATENKTYTAHYEATPRKYTVTFYDEDGVTVRDSQKDVEYGATPVYGGPELSKESTAQYTYAFSQWGDNGVKAVEGDTSYIAHYAATLRQYTVIFANYDNKPLQSSLVDYGTKPAYTGETPAKASDVQYTYTFTGWDPEIADVTGAATYTAKFSETTNQYTVKFYADEAKENLLYSNAFDFGTMPEYSGETPAKAGDAQYSYAFVGWGDNGMKTVTGDTAYIAKFSQSVNQYTVAFYADEAKENLLYSNQFSYGATPEYQGETPAKEGDAQYSYTFSGWSDGIVAVTGDTAYIAKFSQSVNQYTVKFYADEAKENLLYSNEFAYGATPEYQGETPAKAGDAQYSYTFSGWSDGIVAVTGDTAYIAKFDATVNTYSITFEVKGNSALKHTIDNVPYGTLVNDLVAAVKTALGGDSFEDENYIYTFAGIEDLTETDIVTGDETFYVLYTATPKTTTGLENIQQAAPATKVFENGVMYILRDGKKYTMQGEVVD